MLVVITAAVVLPIPCAEANDAALEQLQGTWIGVVAEDEDGGKAILTIEGNRIDFQRDQSPEWYKGEIELGSDNEKPRKLFGTIKECPVKDLIGKVSNGIYKIENDSLTITAAAPGSGVEPQDFGDKNCRTLSLTRKTKSDSTR
tara:strand:- start:11269 stop:11700 length:432 start_codon:yes stop_codon:yes gene_type:complete